MIYTFSLSMVSFQNNNLGSFQELSNIYKGFVKK